MPKKTPKAAKATPGVGRLNTLGGIRREMVRVYTDCRKGELAANEASKLTYMLKCIADVAELELLEARIDRLEKRGKA